MKRLVACSILMFSSLELIGQGNKMVLNLAPVRSISEQPHSPMTARDYYNELFKAGGLDNFADQYVCFRNDDQPVFFLIADSETLKRYLVSVGGINRLPAKDRAYLDKGLAFVVQYHQGVSNGRDYFDRTGPGEYTENLSLPQAPPKQPLKLTRLLRVKLANPSL
jgi:hypothetical protein